MTEPTTYTEQTQTDGCLWLIIPFIVIILLACLGSAAIDFLTH